MGKSEERKCRRAKKQGSRETLRFFPLFCDFRGSKGGLAKAAGAEPAGQMRDEKLHTVVARSTFGSKKCQSTPFSDHFWTLRGGKSARGCGAKHIESKCLNCHMFGPLFDDSMAIQCRKCDAVVARSTFEIQMCQKLRVLSQF